MCRRRVEPDPTVEVVVRIGGELHDVAYLHAGVYAAGVCDIDITDAREQLARSREPLVIERGFVTITLQLATPPTQRVPRKRAERRSALYGAGSLALHLGLWLAAIVYGASELTPSVSESRGTHGPRRARISAPFTAPAQTVRRENKPEPSTTPITTDSTPTPQPRIEHSGAGALRRGQAADGTRAIEPRTPDPGPQRHFDPDANPAFDSIKVGDYSTVSRGSRTGEQYGAQWKRNGLVVVSCDASRCLVLGGENAEPIRAVVEEHLAEITACYAQAAHAAGKKVEIDFGINPAGKVEGLEVGGVGDVGDCVANIIKRARFVAPGDSSQRGRMLAPPALATLDARFSSR
jgi:hypothetical protein